MWWNSTTDSAGLLGLPELPELPELSDLLVLADSGLGAVMEPWSPSACAGSGRRACGPPASSGR
jgi:hypothetical protein